MTLDERLWKAFNKAMGQYQLISDGDHVLLGLSGGKDSLMLTEFMARRARILKPRFNVTAIHIRMQNVSYETATTYLQTFCDNLGVPLHVVTTAFPTDDTQSQHPKPPCFLCSWQRRKLMFNHAQDLGCSKIALGHHQDDIIHTALMNLMFQGHFATMPVSLRMRKMPLTIIRPLCLCRETDIQAYAEAHHYEKQVKLCPHEHATNRTTAAAMFAQMERMNPEARYCIWSALEADRKLVEY
jgi:tRNA(Ile)-lysidine synthase TilS/MesJ